VAAAEPRLGNLAIGPVRIERDMFEKPWWGDFLKAEIRKAEMRKCGKAENG